MNIFRILKEYIRRGFIATPIAWHAMNRTAIKDLIEWKNSDNRKPLLIRGARQVGRTWLMKTFGQKETIRTSMSDFREEERLTNLPLYALPILTDII